MHRVSTPGPARNASNCPRRVAQRARAGTLATAVLGALGLLTGPAPARAADEVSCPVPGPLPVLAERPSDPNRIRIETDGATAESNGDVALSGPVRVRQGDRVLETRDAKYKGDTQAVSADGQIEYRDPQMKLSGRGGVWSPSEGGRFGDADFELPERPARGHADQIAFSPDGKLALQKVEYTSCPVGHRDWALRADHITIDQKAQQGSGRNVRLMFKGVPILYSPVISFPVGDARKSGFLFPAFGQSSRNGFEFSAPYYLNLAPNYDATITPGVMSKRGLTLGLEFRYLTESSRGRFDAEGVPHDSQNGRDRSLLRFTNRSDFLERLRFDTSLAQASDSRYFEDFGLGPEATSVLFLERVARLTYLDTHWRAVALAQEFQTIDRTIAETDRPYARAPQIVVRGRWAAPTGPGIEFGAEAVNFERGTGVTGTRFDFSPTVRYAWRRPGAFLVPALGFRATQYSLRGSTSGEDSPSRTAPTASIDSGLVFERESGGRIQTLEPRVLYTYVPYRDQSRLPLFDTGLPDLNLVQLFRSERYVGGDRLGDANQVAVGATTRFVDSGSGREIVSATLGQTYYFERPRVVLPGETPATANSSDIIAQLVVNAYRNWNVQFGQQWDPHQRSSIRSEVRLQYQPANDKVVNIGYRFRRGLLEQVDGSFAWPVRGAWNLYGRHVYSLRDKSAIESLAGVEYRSCCWRMRLVGRRYVSSRTGAQDTGVSLQLELNGLSSVGEPAGAFLERSIRGYSAVPPGSPSP